MRDINFIGTTKEKSTAKERVQTVALSILGHRKAVSIVLATFILLSASFINFGITASAEGKETGVGQWAANLYTSVQKLSLPIPKPFTQSQLERDIADGNRINLLLIGYGGDGHDGGYLTDTMIVASINTNEHTVSLFNIPRDLDYLGGKINRVYSWQNDAQDVVFAAQDVLGLPLYGWATIDFDGFRKVVDELEGIDVMVDVGFTDYRYPAADASWINSGYITVEFEEGLQHMSGEQALQFARSRYGYPDGGDYARSRRQMKVIEAVKNKALSLDTLPHIPDLLRIVATHFDSSLTIREMSALYEYVKDNHLSIESHIISSENLLVGGYNATGNWLSRPRYGTYAEIHAWVREQLGEEVTAEVWQAPVVGTHSAYPTNTLPAPNQFNLIPIPPEAVRGANGPDPLTP